MSTWRDSEAEFESGWFWSRDVLHDRLRGTRGLWGCEVVLMDPFGEWFGEECVVAAGVVEVLGGVDEGSGAWGVSVGPVGPGVEGVDAVLGVEEPVVVAVEAAGELSVGGDVVLDSAAFGAQFVSLVEHLLCAAGDLVECDVLMVTSAAASATVFRAVRRWRRPDLASSRSA